MHVPHLTLPFFWDEAGQFVPAALDVFHHGDWVPRSTTPNVHPPGVMAYLALVWHIVGYSVVSTRIAMLLIAALGLYCTFLLAIRMCGDVPGAPAFEVMLLLLATPLFYTQAMMAQLDMPAMTFTVLSLLLFLDRKYVACALACTGLVLAKETGAIAPLLFGGWLLVRERKIREALYFTAPFLVLMVWLAILKDVSGNWLGDPGFAHYNVTYSLEPVRAVFALVRRVWYLFGADFRWIGTAAIIYGLRRSRRFFTPEWALLGIFFVLHVVFVSLFGGATLERYLLPVFPILYLAVVTGWAGMQRTAKRVSLGVLTAGMIAGFFWNPPYPFPYENNLAMTDFVRLQKAAAEYLDGDAPQGAVIASAWPYTGALRNPELMMSQRKFNVVETDDFHSASVVKALKNSPASILVVYSRTWEPEYGATRFAPVEQFLRRYYDYEPQITAGEIEEKLGMRSLFRTSQHGQWIEVFTK
jgi:4-amino-4-deoxy-L-arabinose transferase-like glycosyltransferase